MWLQPTYVKETRARRSYWHTGLHVAPADSDLQPRARYVASLSTHFYPHYYFVRII
jgi:hypothetical protein